MPGRVRPKARATLEFEDRVAVQVANGWERSVVLSLRMVQAATECNGRCSVPVRGRREAREGDASRHSNGKPPSCSLQPLREIEFVVANAAVPVRVGLTVARDENAPDVDDAGGVGRRDVFPPFDATALDVQTLYPRGEP